MNEAGDTAPREALRENTLHGVRWVSIARVVAEIAGFASMVVLAHLIDPAEFGRATLATLISAMLAATVFRTLGAPLITRDEVEPRHIQTGLLLSVALGAVLTIVAFLVARLAFGPLFGDRVSELGQLAAPAFLMAGVASVPRALLMRRLDFRRTSTVDMVSLFVGMATSIGLALAGLDAEALVIGGLVAAATDTLLVLAAARVPRPRWDREAAGELASFGSSTGLASLLNAIAKNVDYAIIGARLNAAQVGLYWRAYRLGIEYQSKITGVMMELALPVYSRAKDMADMQRLRFRITRAHAIIVLPLLALFIPLAPTLVPWLFGDAWDQAVEPTQILAVAGMAAALGSGTGSFVIAAGRPWILVRFNLGLLVVFSATVYFTAPYGLTTVCLGVTGARLLLLVGNYHVLLRPLLGVPVRRLWAEVVPGAVGSATLLAVVWPLTALLEAGDVPTVALLAVATLAGAGTYLLALRVLFPDTLTDLALVLRSVLRRGPAPSVVAPVGV
jgi:PST family polysaccharide transporter